MRRFEYAEIHLHGTYEQSPPISYGTKWSWFAGLEQSTVDAILATATESTPSGGLTYMRLWPVDVLNVVGAVGWRVYQMAASASSSSVWQKESYRLIREVGD